MTQQAKILEAFQRGDSLTPLEALDRFGCFRLAAQVFALKKLGYNIQAELVTDGDKTFGRYWINAGDRLIVKPQVAAPKPTRNPPGADLFAAQPDPVRPEWGRQ